MIGLSLTLGQPTGGSVPATAPPVNSSLPAILGYRTVGQTLVSSNGGWTQSPTSYTYVWKKNGTPNGRTAQTYVPVAGDVGATLTVTVTATNVFGSASATTAGVTVAAALTISGAPGTTGLAGNPYSFSPAASGGHASYVYSLSGSLDGSSLSFNPSTGALSAASLGPEATYGPYTITVTDADGLTANLAPFSITVASISSYTLTDSDGTSLTDSSGAALTES